MCDNEFQTSPIKLNKTFAIDFSRSPVFTQDLRDWVLTVMSIYLGSYVLRARV